MGVFCYRLQDKMVHIKLALTDKRSGWQSGKSGKMVRLMGEDWNMQKLRETIKKEFASELMEPKDEDGERAYPDSYTSYAITWIDEDNDEISIETDKHLEVAMDVTKSKTLRLEIV